MINIKQMPKQIIGRIHPTVIDTINGRYMVVINSTNNTNGWYSVPTSFTFADAQKLFKQSSIEQIEDESKIFKILNSKGTGHYTVTFNRGVWSCDCTGYGFRQKCRHIDEAKTKLV